MQPQMCLIHMLKPHQLAYYAKETTRLHNRQIRQIWGTGICQPCYKRTDSFLKFQQCCAGCLRAHFLLWFRKNFCLLTSLTMEVKGEISCTFSLNTLFLISFCHSLSQTLSSSLLQSLGFSSWWMDLPVTTHPFFVGKRWAFQSFLFS